MKKSILLFIIWAIACFVLTSIYLALTMYSQNFFAPLFEQILFLATMIMSIAMMTLIHGNAKIEQTTWLKVVSTVLFIFYSACGGVALLIFTVSLLL